MTNFKKILVAVDGSAPSFHAARAGLELATALHASLTLAYSVPPLVLAGELSTGVVAEVMRAEIAHGKQVLDMLVRELGPVPMQVHTLELEGPAATRIAEVAETHGYDLVIVGSRGKNAGDRVILGSVTDRLVHVCKKPVLVVR